MFRYSGQRCIRKDLIEKELTGGRNCEVSFKEQKLSNRFVDWLFRHYKTHEFTIHFYDDEPSLRGDLEYDDPWWETSEGIAYAWQKFRENEERRMTFNNWIDVYGEGIWGLSQRQVDKYAKGVMKSVRNWPVKKKERIYCGVDGDWLLLYCYGRDFGGIDYWWVMHRGDNGWNYELTEVCKDDDREESKETVR